MNIQAVSEIRRRLRARGAHAYLAYTPSNIFYLTGFRSYFASEWWRMHGTVLAVVPAAEDAPVTLVVSDFESATAAQEAPGVRQCRYRLWVDLQTAAELASAPDGAEVVRPEQWHEADLDAAFASALADLGNPDPILATDLRYVAHDSLERIRRIHPGSDLIDFTDELYSIRLIKQRWEVDRLAAGVALSEAGMTYAARHLEPGMTARHVRLLYQTGVTQNALEDHRFEGFTDSWVLPTVGGQTSASYGERSAGLTPGDLVKFDCGTTVDGYRSDGGRTWAYKTIRPDAQRLYDVLSAAQQIAVSALVPGACISDVFKTAMHHVQTDGFPAYNRGHIGHSVGIDSFHEEPPYLSPGCHEVVRAGSVFAVELPSYTPDIGAIMIEDLVHVTADGPVVLHSLPHGLQVV